MANLSTQTTQLLKKVNEAKQVMSVYGTKLAKKFEEWANQPAPSDSSSTDGVVVVPTIAERATLSAAVSPQATSEAFFRILAQGTERLCKALEVADEKVFKEQSEDQDAILQRDQTLEATRASVIALKKSLEGSYGANMLADLGLSGETSEDPVELHRLIKAALGILEQKTTWPSPQNPLFPSWSADALKTYLQNLWQQLETVVGRVRQEARETQDAQIERRTAMENLNQAIIAFNATLESVARLVGEIEIANRIRPFGGRPRKSQDETDPSTDPTTDPSTTPNPAPNTTPNASQPPQTP